MRLLRALDVQTISASEFEVLVVVDGSTDDTLAKLHERPSGYRLTVLQQPQRGAGSARNLGASEARGDLLVFLDDDVEPLPGLLAAYLQTASEKSPNSAFLGRLEVKIHGTMDLARIGVRAWWQTQEAERSGSGHRFSFRDLLTGNFALSSKLFSRLDGFDSSFTCHEDYEFGVRLLAAGVSFRYCPEAKALHHEERGVRGGLARAYDEGVGDVQLANKFPYLLPSLYLNDALTSRQLKWKATRQLAFRLPLVGDRLMRLVLPLLHMTELLKIRKLWRGLHKILQNYNYIKGAYHTAGRLERLLYLRGASAAPTIEDRLSLDMQEFQGISGVSQELDYRRPNAVTFLLGKTPIGEVPRVPGAEPLEGRHLRGVLAERIGDFFLGWTAVHRFEQQRDSDQASSDGRTVERE
jgi:glycosyltransferase involved in cell wall biosynthesis